METEAGRAFPAQLTTVVHSPLLQHSKAFKTEAGRPKHGLLLHSIFIDCPYLCMKLLIKNGGTIKVNNALLLCSSRVFVVNEILQFPSEDELLSFKQLKTNINHILPLILA